MAYTKRIYFKAIENYFNENDVVIPKTAIKGEGELQDDITSQDVINFVNHEIELLDRKHSKTSQTKTQKENELIKESIVKALTEIDRPVTITELQNESAEMANYSNQKLSALLKQLVQGGIVTKTIDKKKSYFSVER